MSKTKTDIDSDLEELARRLQQSEDYKILRRVPAPTLSQQPVSSDAKYALILDTETTGLNLRADEVIEIGLLLVDYSGRKLGVIRDLRNEMRQPTREIPIEVQRLTGITPDAVKGKKIDRAKVSQMISSASIVIAHNAAFDRPMCERLFPELEEKPWACSLSEIPWSQFGFESAKLKYLLIENGFFFEGHRALDDCAALNRLLNLQSPKGGSYFEILMDNARAASFEISVSSPYELRKTIREMDYRWVGFDERPGGVWRKSVKHDQVSKESAHLSELRSRGVTWIVKEQDAFSRYRLS